MQAPVKIAIVVLLAAGIGFVVQQGRQLAQQGSLGGGAILTGTNWRPTTVDDEAYPGDSGIFVSFEVDGSIKGHGGCNSFSGSLKQTDSGIGVGPLGVTRMSCAQAIMDREFAFLEALQKMTGFQADNDSMRLLDDDGAVLAEFVAGTQ